MNTFVTTTFLDALATLQPDERRACSEAALRFIANPYDPRLRLHPVRSARDTGFQSIAASEGLRVIVHTSDAGFALCHAGQHDPAYAWAERNVFRIDRVAGTAQIVEVTTETRTVVQERRVGPAAPRPFESVSDSALRDMSVPTSWWALVRDADQETFVHRLLDRLPEAAALNLLAFHDGDPLPHPPTSRRSDGDPLQHPDGPGRYRIVERHATLAFRRALDAPWERWRTFLHPSQSRIVERSYGGPVHLRGGPGTGKSLVVLHRAARLARSSGDGRVLVTTFSKTLAARLSVTLDRLLEDNRDARDRIDVVHLHHWAVDRWKRTHPDLGIVGDDLLRDLVAEAMQRADAATLDVHEVLDEWRNVIDERGVTTLDAYLALTRVGRSRPLPRERRRQIWRVAEILRDALTARHTFTFAGVCHAVADDLLSSGHAPYRHVLADEAQDFGPAELRLLRALVAPSSDDLFLSIDPAQRIYRGASSLAGAGIRVAGRSAVLRFNYRTTEEIRSFAHDVAHDPTATAAVRAQARHDDAYPIVSVVEGPPPHVVCRATVSQEIDAAAAWLKKRLRDGARPGDVAIFTRTHKLLAARAAKIVSAVGLHPAHLADETSGDDRRVWIGTMHRAKGLEFKIVMIVGCDDDVVPAASALASASDAHATSKALERERNLLYVACTRARNELFLSGKGTLSRFVPSVRGRGPDGAP